MKLLEKLLKITEDMGGLGKEGQNPNFKYAYVRGEDAIKKFREFEIKYKIKVIPVIQSSTLLVTKLDKGNLVSAVMDYNIYDVESDEKITVSLPSSGWDSTDKSAFKLMTGALKYFILQTFTYSSDDPEAEKELPLNKEDIPSTATKAEFKPVIKQTVVSSGPASISKFGDMLPKTGGVSFKDSGLSKGFKPAGE
jgi:hypothetical protein